MDHRQVGRESGGSGCLALVDVEDGVREGACANDNFRALGLGVGDDRCGLPQYGGLLGEQARDSDALRPALPLDGRPPESLDELLELVRIVDVVIPAGPLLLHVRAVVPGDAGPHGVPHVRLYLVEGDLVDHPVQ